MLGRGLLIWDLDDTLIITNPEYEKTNEICAEIIAGIAKQDCTKEKILAYQRQRDLELVKQNGFASSHYLQSWMDTVEHIHKTYGLISKNKAIQMVSDAVDDLFRRKFNNAPGCIEVLEHLKYEAGYSMIVLTAGEQNIQLKRIREAGISEYMDKVYVYPWKDPKVLREVIFDFTQGTFAGPLFMIGNSLRSDIYPAIQNRMGAIHVLTNTWEIDHMDIDLDYPFYFSVENLRKIPLILESVSSLKEIPSLQNCCA